MANNWNSIELESFFPPGLKTLASTIDTITSTATTILEIQKTITTALSAVATDALDAQALAIQAATKAIQDTLDVFTGDAKMHLLVVPFRKQPTVRLPSTVTMPHATDSDEAYNEDPTLESLERTYDAALRRVGFADGGNKGYARTVIETLQDVFDVNRPQFDDDHAIYANVWVSGATDVVGIIDSMYTLAGLFGTALQNESPVPPNIMRTPQDLKARVVASPTEPKVAVLLEWVNPPAQQTFAELGEVRIRLDEVAVIRSTNDFTRNAHSWEEIFGGTQPPALPTNTRHATNTLVSADGKSTVIAQWRHDNTTASYIDELVFDQNVNYYYAVAYKYAIATPPDVKTFRPQSFRIISNVEKIRIEAGAAIPKTLGGVKPDWIATPNVLGLIPDMQFYVKIIQALVDSLRSKALGANAALKSYLAFLDAEVLRFQQAATFVTAQVTKLNTLLKTPEAGIYATTIAADRGGVNLFVRELTQRLTDETDTSAPPFFSDTEYVAGFIMLAGAPNPAGLVNVQTLFELLFGNPQAPTPFEAAVASIDRILREEEAIAFDESMAVVTPDEVTTITPSKTFNDALQPVDAGSDDANIPFDP